MALASRQPSAIVRAAIYTRISSDPDGQRAGVERQRADCEALCVARGWEVGEVHEDNDCSAYGRKPRRAYERMLAAVESGAVTAIVTWHNDRLHRSPKQLEAFIDLVERSGVRLAVVTGGDYDLTTPDGRLSARIVGAVARKGPRTEAAGSVVSTLSSPSRASPPGNWDGAFAARRSAYWSGRRPSACWLVTVS